MSSSLVDIARITARLRRCPPADAERNWSSSAASTFDAARLTFVERRKACVNCRLSSWWSSWPRSDAAPAPASRRSRQR